MTIVFNANVSQYTIGDFATFKDGDSNGIARAKGYVNAGYASVVVEEIASETPEKPDGWSEPKTVNKTK